MGGRRYKNNVKNYLDSNKRTAEFKTAIKLDEDNIEILYDKQSPKAPIIPIFSNSPNKIYAVVGKNGKIKNINFYDDKHMLVKSIHLDHVHNNIKDLHVHEGDNYYHVEGKTRPLTADELKIVLIILQSWKTKEGK